MFTDQTLAGKNILVTGGGSGLGFAMASRFAELGANVAICGRNQEKLNRAAESLLKNGNKVATYAVDVRDYEGVGKMIESLIQELGFINGLVNNAAGNFLCASEELSPNGFKSVVDIVLNGTFNCTQQLGKRWIDAQQKGSILNIVTTYTETGCAFVLPSACAKAGVYALTTTLAYEWGPYGIRCNSIAPGPFPTEGAWSRLMPTQDFQEMYIKRHPMGRVGEHIELANLAVFLMSDLAPYINGECVTIDGGERLQGAEFNHFMHMVDRNSLKQLFQAMRPKSK
jgi:NAD(P)-dependent dehydrogenase (short-subunit alcohol dehydrogenase family)